MTTTTEQPPIREIVCSNCGEPLGEYSRTERTKVGRCCFNLPDPWDMPGEESDDEEECDCWDCQMERRDLDAVDFVGHYDGDVAQAQPAFTEYALHYLDREPHGFETRYFERLSS